jgi:serine protease AprX
MSRPAPAETSGACATLSPSTHTRRQATSSIRILFITAFLLSGATAFGQPCAFWVAFTDKGPKPAAALDRMTAAELSLSRAALERRAAMAGIPLNGMESDNAVLSLLRAHTSNPSTLGVNPAVIGEEDLPVVRRYIDAVLATGARLRATSRWMNAVSIEADASVIEAVRALPFVASVEPVRRVKRMSGDRVEAPGALGKSEAASGHGMDYGLALAQVNMINVPKVHDVWIDGTDCLVGMLDVGYKWRSHEALKNINILGEYDFINKDSVTENQDGDPAGQDGHGTITLSALAGYKPGVLMGPAFKASFYLAKTEVVSSETSIEEDYWVQGMEWLESNGIAIASASLGYNTFDDSTGYYYDRGDFDGKTAVTTRAAARAARLGVVLCTAMGNEGNRPGTLLVPADADTVLSIGAVNYSDNVAGFSSNGPTNDGRTKPDVMAPGVSVWCAGTASPADYFTANGTSLATPLAAGVATLVRSARPELTPVQVRAALRNTADFASAPDNSHGWGKVDAWAALLYHGMVISTDPKVLWDGTRNVIAVYVLSPSAVYTNKVTVTYAVGKGNDCSVEMQLFESYPGMPSGSGLYLATLPVLTGGVEVRYFISAQDIKESRTSPYGAPGKRHSFLVGESRSEGAGSLTPSTYALFQSYPNPYNYRTETPIAIRYDVPAPGAPVRIELFESSGRSAGVLLDAFEAGGPHVLRVVLNDLSAGTYFYTLTAQGQQLVKRLVVVR